MGTIQTSTTLIAPTKPLSGFPAIETLESKIVAAVVELDFYHKLLSWLLFSCHEEKRHSIETFRKELADLRKSGFSVLRDGLERLKNGALSETGQPDLHSDIAHLERYFNHSEGALQSLKSKIFQGFGDFTHVCIW